MTSTKTNSRLHFFRMTSIALAFGCLHSLALFAQPFEAKATRVELRNLTTCDHPTAHLEVLSSTLSKAVKIPNIDTSGARFMSVFYSWAVTKDPVTAIMVLQKRGGQELFIDKNYNNDLTDDGPPMFFPDSTNALDFEIVSRADSLQRVLLRLMRKPDVRNLPDSMVSRSYDKGGNLTSRLAKVWGMFKGQPDFTGTSGTFFWDDRVTLRRGKMQVDGKLYEIGLLDYDSNGLYNDQKDLLLVDNSQSGHLDVWDESQIFKLNDVFALGAKHFRLTSADKYGKWIDVVETKEPLTFYYMKELDSLKSRMGTGGSGMSEIDTGWANITATTIDGKTVRLGEFRGKYILVNFWGEWCKPCLEEVPTLVSASKEYAQTKLQIISFLRSYNVPKAREAIQKLNITWPQLMLSPELEKQFKIQGYPTNILIWPNGKEAKRVAGVGSEFFREYIK